MDLAFVLRGRPSLQLSLSLAAVIVAHAARSQAAESNILRLAVGGDVTRRTVEAGSRTAVVVAAVRVSLPTVLVSLASALPSAPVSLPIAPFEWSHQPDCAE